MQPQKKDEKLVSLWDVTTRIGANVIHQHLDLEIRRGDSLALIGGSGAGKSVLLQVILGLRPPATGRVLAFGKSVYQSSEKELWQIRQRWGVLFQSGALFSSQTVAENIKTPLRQYTKLSAALMDELAAVKLDMVGLPLTAGKKYPSELSGGMRKRAGLARALALDPELVFLDEPTAGLDPISAGRFDDLMSSLRESLGLTMCMVTHDFDSVYSICKKVAVLAQKKIVAVVSPEDLFTVNDTFVQELSHEVRCERPYFREMSEGAGA